MHFIYGPEVPRTVSHGLVFCSSPGSLSAPVCSTFGLDRDSVINQYITTLLLLQEDEEAAGDHGTGRQEMPPLCHADALERVLQIIPMLRNTSELTDSLCAAIFKVCAWALEEGGLFVLT